jgi:hypothetical protein
MIDSDVNSLYASIRYDMNWYTDRKSRPRSLELRIQDDLLQRYTVYHSGGDWWADKDRMHDWCSDHFGHRDSGYNNPRWSQHAFEFRFKNEKDAMFFILKWG